MFRFAHFIGVILFGFCLGFTATAQDASPSVDGRYASIVVDADSLEILHARQIDELRYPASLTKVMTLMLVFDALEAGEITLDTKMVVSKTAAKTQPVKVYLKAGETITIGDAIQAIAVKSANDAAVVVAEHLAGNTEEFAQMMTDRARSLGMQSTTFMTPNGLPDPEQVTTARDMAKLAAAVLRTHPEQYKWFGQKTFRFRGATYRNTNGLLHSLSGVDGFKTGFTNDSGYNLIISAERLDTAGIDRRLIAVVLGGASGKSRNAHMSDLIETSFEQLGVAPAPNVTRIVEVEDTPTLQPVIEVLSLRRSDGTKTRISRDAKVASLPALSKAGWTIRVGRFDSVPAARDQLGALFGMDPALTNTNAIIQPMPRGYEARFTNLSFEAATQACKILSGLQSGCALMAPTRSKQ